jgi:enamine deaminase RidA (YjgF/YER057c/UK114 family)
MVDDQSSGAAHLDKRVSPGLVIVTLSRHACREYFITSVARRGESVAALFQRVAEAVRRENAQVVSQEVFGIAVGPRVRGDGANVKALENAFGAIEAPVTWLENGHQTGLCGTHLWAVSGPAVRSLELDGRIIGSMFEDDYAQYCRLGGLLPKDTSRSPSEQTAEIFQQMDAVLQRNGMEFSNVIRTWFYNDNILDWYDEFNKVRNDFFLKKRIFETLLPASTGVGGRNAAGTALAGGLLAVVPLDKAVRAAAVPSPLQDSATEYGSSFSRAVELALPDHSRLYVSGTASIDPTGRTAHAGDPEAQVKLTMEVVYTILKSRGMGWDNAKRALAYFKHAKDAPIFQKYCTQNNLRQFPAVIVENDICRDELLFEIEVDAIRTK